MSALEAVLHRRSWSKVTDKAPTDDELLPLIAAAGRVADHSSLRPWRIITLRGDDRDRLGRALNRADGEKGSSSKPLRAPLLLAVVFSRRPSGKVPSWEQEAVASGVAHTLSLLLDEAGWGVLWRTGEHTRSRPVAALHGLSANEQLLGWLYVGGKIDDKDRTRKSIDAVSRLSALPSSKDVRTITGAHDIIPSTPGTPALSRVATPVLPVKKKKKKKKSGGKAAKAEHEAAKAERKATKAAKQVAVAE